MRLQKSPKVDGPRIRAEEPLITLLKNACAEIHENPNSGSPEFLRAGLKVWAEIFDEHSVRRAIRFTARQHGMTDAQVQALLEKACFNLEE